MDCGTGNREVNEIESNGISSLDQLSSYFERRANEIKLKIKPERILLSPLERKHRKRIAEVRWHKSHPSELREANRRWRERHPDKVRELNQRYQRRLKERKSNLSN